MITLVLAHIGFEGRHGATAAERRTTRRFEVDVELSAPVDAAGRSDKLADTVDYRVIADTVVAVGGGGPYKLLEHLGTRLIAALQEIAPRAGVTIELRKLNPPACAGNPTVAAVRMSAPARTDR